jgi:hypothetical protein
MTREPRYGKTEEARDTRAALAERLAARKVVIERYTAQGLATAKISVQCERFPDAVMLIGAALHNDQGGPLTLSPSFNFVWHAPSRTAQVYEPGGLVSNTAYRLIFLVVGG